MDGSCQSLTAAERCQRPCEATSAARRWASTEQFRGPPDEEKVVVFMTIVVIVVISVIIIVITAIIANHRHKSASSSLSSAASIEEAGGGGGRVRGRGGEKGEGNPLPFLVRVRAVSNFRCSIRSDASKGHALSEGGESNESNEGYEKCLQRRPKASSAGAALAPLEKDCECTASHGRRSGSRGRPRRGRGPGRCSGSHGRHSRNRGWASHGQAQTVSPEESPRAAVVTSRPTNFRRRGDARR